MRPLLAMLAAVNPAAVAVVLWPRERAAAVATAAAVTWGLVLAAAGFSEPLLDALDVSAATFRIATGVVVGLAGARWLVFGASPVEVDTRPGTWRRIGVPLLIPALVSPQLAMVAISTGADDGTLVAAWTAAPRSCSHGSRRRSPSDAALGGWSRCASSVRSAFSSPSPWWWTASSRCEPRSSREQVI